MKCAGKPFNALIRIEKLRSVYGNSQELSKI
jgi:hypothetical protein